MLNSEYWRKAIMILCQLWDIKFTTDLHFFLFLKLYKNLNSVLPARESGAICLPGANTVQYKKYKINIHSFMEQKCHHVPKPK